MFLTKKIVGITTFAAVTIGLCVNWPWLSIVVVPVALMRIAIALGSSDDEKRAWGNWF